MGWSPNHILSTLPMPEPTWSRSIGVSIMEYCTEILIMGHIREDDEGSGKFKLKRLVTALRRTM